MKTTTVALAALALAQQALASLNCTAVAPVTARECEWDDCAARTTVKVGEVLHAGCRADCSSLSDPWLQLYDGSFVKTNQLLANCRYFCNPYEITGLPTCAWEHNVTDPGLSVCAASSIMGVANKIAKTLTLGSEPAPFNGVPTAGSACDWTKTPASLPATSTRRPPGSAASTPVPATPVPAPPPTAATGGSASATSSLVTVTKPPVTARS